MGKVLSSNTFMLIDGKVLLSYTVMLSDPCKVYV